MTTADDSDPGRNRRRIVALFVAAVAVELLYWFVISAGTFTRWPFTIHFLDDLAEGFRHGHLHLIVEPPAALLSRPNPFAPDNRELWYWDASLYKGQYYLYWGPVPALLLAAVKTVFRISAVVGDHHVVFWLTTLQLIAGTLFIERVGRLFRRPPLVLEVAAVVVLGVANPVLYNLARPAVYEAAIVGGEAFLLLGLVFAFDAVAADDLRRARLAAAGACWGAAFGCRISLAPAVALLVAATVLGMVFGKPDRLRRALVVSLWVGTPVALALLAFLTYNRLRFDAWFEFGLRYQLSWIELQVALRFIPANLHAYLWRPPAISCRFPFAYALADVGARAFPAGYTLPTGYFVYEQVAGLLPTVPWSYFAPVAVLAAARTSWRTRLCSPRTWTVGVTAIIALVALGPDLVLSTATNRYLGDVTGGMTLLGALGAFTTVEAVQDRRGLHLLAVALALVLAAATAAMGFALGLKGQYAHFEANNPPLYQKLVQRLSVCRGEIPPEPK